MPTVRAPRRGTSWATQQDVVPSWFPQLRCRKPERCYAKTLQTTAWADLQQAELDSSALVRTTGWRSARSAIALR